MIVVINPSQANSDLFSSFVYKTLNKEQPITHDLDKIEQAKAIIVYELQNISRLVLYLAQNDLTDTLKSKAKNNVPILGVCKGMDILFTSTYDGNYYKGLNLIHGHIFHNKNKKKEISKECWIVFERPHPLLRHIEDGYAFVDEFISIDKYNKEDVLGTHEDNSDSIAMAARNNVVGTRLRPEISGELGANLLKRYADLII